MIAERRGGARAPTAVVRPPPGTEVLDGAEVPARTTDAAAESPQNQWRPRRSPRGALMIGTPPHVPPPSAAPSGGAPAAAPPAMRPLREWHRPLTLFAAAAGVLAVLFCVGLVVDGRTVLGEPVWLKPLKFAVSFGLYTATLAWMFALFPRWRRTLWTLGTAVTAACVLETVIITYQAARGQRSHFNYTTPMDAQLQELMGMGAVVLLLGTLAIGALLVWQRRVDRPMSWAIRIGVLVSVAGMAIGPLMTQPTPDQEAVLETGAEAHTVGAHTVDAPDGGPGLPVTSWSTEGGDLRIAHFVGLHGLQALPLLALGLGAAAPRVRLLRGEGTRTALVAVAGAGYTGAVALLAWQALRGQPLLQPDAATLAAAAGLAAAVTLGVGATAALAARSAGR
jgi:hypothetical protein